MTTPIAEFLDVSDEDLVAALGGTWQSIEFECNQGADGNPIYAWFVPDDPRPVALGIGSQGLYVAPLLGDDDQGFALDLDPRPRVALWWAPDLTASPAANRAEPVLEKLTGGRLDLPRRTGPVLANWSEVVQVHGPPTRPQRGRDRTGRLVPLPRDARRATAP